MFTDTLTRWLEGIAAVKDQYHIRKISEPIFDRMSSATLTSPGIVISSGGATTAKTGASDTYGVANGTLWKVASGTTLPALVGTITAAYFNVFCFFVDSAGTITVAMGTQGATLGAVVFPQFPQKKALLGFLIVTYASTFTGGTTPLDTATTVYVNSNEAFDPACLLGN
jgi:hypothetical protein